MTDQSAPRDKSKGNAQPPAAGGSAHKQTDEDYGYYFYPDRGGRSRDKSLLGKLSEGRSSKQAMKCISNVYWCAEKSERLVCLYVVWSSVPLSLRADSGPLAL